MDGFLGDCIGKIESPDKIEARNKDLIAACTEAFIAAVAKDKDATVFYRYLVARIQTAVLLVFLLVTLVSIYRYNIRISGFYHARADALELMDEAFSQDRFDGLSATLAADKLEFKAPRTPVNAIIDITKAVIGKLGK